MHPPSTATVQLGELDVPVEVLDQDGTSIELVLKEANAICPDPQAAVSTIEPRVGWRSISNDMADPTDRWIAAPVGDKWALVNIIASPGEPLHLSRYTELVSPIPGRQDRSRNLRIRFDDAALTWREGQIPVISFEVSNDSEFPFPQYAADSTKTIAWLINQDGTQLPARSWVAFSPNNQPVIPPRSEGKIEAELLTENPQQLAPGQYVLEARILSLGLRIRSNVIIQSAQDQRG